MSRKHSEMDNVIASVTRPNREPGCLYYWCWVYGHLKYFTCHGKYSTHFHQHIQISNIILAVFYSNK